MRSPQTIGVAALGSVLNNKYASSIEPELAEIPLPEGALGAAEESVGAATQIAYQFPDYGEQVLSAAHNSFIDGWQLMALVAGSVAVLAVIVVFSFLPSRPLPPSQGEENIR